jgi:hypothetical protein
MFSNKLIPTRCEKEQQIIDYTFIKSKISTCGVCNSKINMMYTTYLLGDNKCTKTCYLCHIVLNFKKYHSNKIFLIESTLSQLEIIQKIITYYNDYKQIPNLNLIDNSCKIIKNIRINDYIDNYKDYPKIKIYFNPNVLSYLTDLTQNMFCKKYVEDNTLSNYTYVVNFYDENEKTKKCTSYKNRQLSEKSVDETTMSFTNKHKNLQILNKIKSQI